MRVKIVNRGTTQVGCYASKLECEYNGYELDSDRCIPVTDEDIEASASNKYYRHEVPMRYRQVNDDLIFYSYGESPVLTTEVNGKYVVLFTTDTGGEFEPVNITEEELLDSFYWGIESLGNDEYEFELDAQWEFEGVKDPSRVIKFLTDPDFMSDRCLIANAIRYDPCHVKFVAKGYVPPRLSIIDCEMQSISYEDFDSNLGVVEYWENKKALNNSQPSDGCIFSGLDDIPKKNSGETKSYTNENDEFDIFAGLREEESETNDEDCDDDEDDGFCIFAL